MFDNLEKVNNSKRILIIDGTNNLIRAVSVAQNYKLSSYGIFFKILGNLISQFKPSECYIIFDGQGGNVTKRILFPQYKMNRSSVSKVQTEDYQKLFQILKHTPIITLRLNGVQGDNVMGHIAIKNQNLGNRVTIASSDKDFYQLCSKSIQVWDPIRKTLITEGAVIQKYNCHPVNFPVYKCLVGDSSDNIIGIKGLGQKTIIRYFGDLFKDELPLQGDVRNFEQYVKIMDHSDMKLKLLENLPLISKLYKIVNLRSGCIISPQIGIKIDQIINSKKNNLEFDKPQFINQCKKYFVDSENQSILYTALHLISKK